MPSYLTVASLTKDVKSQLAKRPLIFNGHLANRGLTSLVRGHLALIQYKDAILLG